MGVGLAVVLAKCGNLASMRGPIVKASVEAGRLIPLLAGLAEGHWLSRARALLASASDIGMGLARLGLGCVVVVGWRLARFICTVQSSHGRSHGQHHRLVPHALGHEGHQICFCWRIGSNVGNDGQRP